MKKIDTMAIFVVVLCAILLIGEVHAYSSADGRYSSDAYVDGGSIDYSMSATGAKEFDVVLLDNGGYTSVTSVYIYYDESFVSTTSERSDTEIGAVDMTEEYYLDQVEKVLRYRGIADITWVNAEELRSSLISDVSGSSAVGKGLIAASGALPNTVYSGTASDLILEWISAGGSLYWSGYAVGEYVSGADDVSYVGATELFTGTSSFNAEDSSGNSDTVMRSVFSYEYNRLLYSIDTSTTARETLCAGYTDGTYSSTTFVEMGAGQVCILGGEFDSKQVRDLAISVASGLCYCSQILEHVEGTVNDEYSSEMILPSTTGKLQLYMYMGGYFCVYGKGYEIS